MRVCVVYAAPGVEAMVAVDVPPGATVRDAVDASGLLDRPGIAPATLTFAIFGEPAEPRTPLEEGDRIELLRPLVANPKDARRRRAQEKPLPRAPPRRKRGDPG